MKKVLLSALAGICIIGATVASSNNTGIRIASRQVSTDTIPKDTSKMPAPDTTSPKLAYVRLNSNLTDTLPKDTTKPDTSALAYVRYSSNLTDTLPKDTTKPDTSRLAYVRYSTNLTDTFPKDTTKPDTSKLVAFVR
jgi:hypothetical protein